jgi:pimeloyl-ACP methyl ester carboxylesterase
MDLAYERAGHGAPLVLLHGLGADRRSWTPVIPYLTGGFDVVTIDLPGFGRSTQLDVEPTPRALARAVAAFLDAHHIDTPHLAGNSLGGWVALELAAIRPIASIALLSPAGLWPGCTPWYCRTSLATSRWLTERWGRPLSAMMRFRAGRALVLGQTHGRPGRTTPAYARAAIEAMGTCSGFPAAFDATLSRRYTAGPVLAPVTIAFGGRDRLILKPWRRLDELPAGTRSIPLPGCGHLPMADDPVAVAGVITASVAAIADAPAAERNYAAGVTA